MEVKKQIREFILKNALSGSTGIALDDEDSFLEKEVNDDELIPDNFDSVNKLNEYVKKKKGA